MKRILWIIIMALTVTFCTLPAQIDISHAGNAAVSCPSDSDDDENSMQQGENISINYARKDKRVKIERQIRVVERALAEKAVHFYLKEFNETGLLTETIKRDYSGEDPFNIGCGRI